MDVHETLLKLIVAVTDHHYHIIHAQESIYLIECASITSVSRNYALFSLQSENEGGVTVFSR